MSTLLTIKDITREAVAVLHEELSLAKHATRKYEDRFGKKSGQIGTSVDIRKPPRFAVGTTAAVTFSSNTVEDYVTLKAETRRNVQMQFSSLDLTLSINDFSKQFIRPAVSRLAREVDIVGFDALLSGPQSRLTHDVATDLGYADYVTVNARLTQQLAPEADRVLFADAITHAVIVTANKGLFQSAEQIKQEYEKGYMGTSGGFDWVSTQNAPVITFDATTPAAAFGTVKTTVAEAAASLVLTGGTSGGIIKKGQGFTVAGCYAIDPETGNQLPYLYTFIAAADATLTLGEGTVTLGEKCYTIAGSGNTLGNMAALPTATKAATATELNAAAGKSVPVVFGIQKDALALASIGLQVPSGVDMAASESFDGIGLRIVRQYDGASDVFNTRIDVQFGWATLRKELIASVCGKQG